MSIRTIPRRSKLSGLLVSVALVVHGCGTPPADKAPDGNDDASKGLDTSAAVSAGKGATLELSTGAKLVIPADAVTTDVEVTMRRPADTQAESLLESVPANYKVASAPYILTPHGTQFAQDVEITLPIAAGVDASKLVVAWLKDEQDTHWVTLGKPEVANGKATMKLRHFSVVVLLETETEDNGEHVLDPGTSDKLKLTSLSVTSHPMGDLETTLDVELTGEGFEGELDLILLGRRLIRVEPTSPTKATVKLSYIFSTARTYKLSVGYRSENAQGEWGYHERSNELAFTVTGTNPVPTLLPLERPVEALGRCPEVDINGAGFGLFTTITASQGSTTHTLILDHLYQDSISVEFPDRSVCKTAGKWTLTVTNPAPGGGSAIVPGGLEFSTEATPRVNAWRTEPSILLSNSAEQELVIEGGGWVSATTAFGSLNGGSPQPLPVVSFDDEFLTVMVPTTLLTDNGTLTVEVSNPAPGGGSGTVEVGVVAPLKPVKLTSVTPSVVAANTIVDLTLVGEDFPHKDDATATWDATLHRPDGTTQVLGRTQDEFVVALTYWIPVAGTYQISVVTHLNGNTNASVESNRLDLVVE